MKQCSLSHFTAGQPGPPSRVTERLNRPWSISGTCLLPNNRRVLFLLSAFSPPSFLPSSSWFKKDMAKEEKY